MSATESLVVDLVDQWQGNAVIGQATIVKATSTYYIADNGRKWRRTDTREIGCGTNRRSKWPGAPTGRPAPRGALTPETCIALERHFGTSESIDAMEAMFGRGKWAPK